MIDTKSPNRPERPSRLDAIRSILPYLFNVTLWVVLISLFAALLVGQIPRIGSGAKGEAIAIEPDAEVAVKGMGEMMVGAAPNERGPKQKSHPIGAANYAKYIIYFGTDRTRSAPFSGVSFWAFTFFAIALLVSLFTDLLAVFADRLRWRVTAFVLFALSLLLAGYAIVSEFLPFKYNRFATEAFGDGVDELSVGVCNVSVPYAHAMGGLEGPHILDFEFRENPDKHVVLHRVQILDKETFRTDVNDELEKSAWPEALVFVHGYNVSFEDAARRTAQLTHDLRFAGVPAFFSWPSNGHFESYTWDANSADYAALHFRQFLDLLASAHGLKRIHVVAHSMGNRCVSKALERQLPLPNSCHLDQCILAAADVDATLFERDYAPGLIKQVGRATLYASANDTALHASQYANRYPRAGDTSNLVVMKGLETVDASKLETDFLGHSYFSDNTNMIEDIRQIIEDDLPAASRRGMHEQRASGNLKYWEFHPPTGPAPGGG